MAERRVFLSPHPDDETLFGTFTLLREKPLVVCVLSCGAHRAAEFANAMAVLNVEDIGVWGAYPETAPDWTAIRERILALNADHLYVPDYHPDGNEHHNALAMAAAGAAPRVTHYLTYTPSGKQRDGTPVPYEPAWIGLKLRALACYPSQYGQASHAPHFMRGLDEYHA
jgi:LmbE family N-acetylglucosaminyl deacetylase